MIVIDNKKKQEILWSKVRHMAKDMLHLTDHYILPDHPRSNDQQVIDYRSSLRGLRERFDTPEEAMEFLNSSEVL